MISAASQPQAPSTAEGSSSSKVNHDQDSKKPAPADDHRASADSTPANVSAPKPKNNNTPANPENATPTKKDNHPSDTATATTSLGAGAEKSNSGSKDTHSNGDKGNTSTLPATQSTPSSVLSPPLLPSSSSSASPPSAAAVAAAVTAAVTGSAPQGKEGSGNSEGPSRSGKTLEKKPNSKKGPKAATATSSEASSLPAATTTGDSTPNAAETTKPGKEPSPSQRKRPNKNKKADRSSAAGPSKDTGASTMPTADGEKVIASGESKEHHPTGPPTAVGTDGAASGFMKALNAIKSPRSPRPPKERNINNNNSTNNINTNSGQPSGAASPDTKKPDSFKKKAGKRVKNDDDAASTTSAHSAKETEQDAAPKKTPKAKKPPKASAEKTQGEGTESAVNTSTPAAPSPAAGSVDSGKGASGPKGKGKADRAPRQPREEGSAPGPTKFEKQGRAGPPHKGEGAGPRQGNAREDSWQGDKPDRPRKGPRNNEGWNEKPASTSTGNNNSSWDNNAPSQAADNSGWNPQNALWMSDAKKPETAESGWGVLEPQAASTWGSETALTTEKPSKGEPSSEWGQPGQNISPSGAPSDDRPPRGFDSGRGRDRGGKSNFGRSDERRQTPVRPGDSNRETEGGWNKHDHHAASSNWAQNRPPRSEAGPGGDYNRPNNWNAEGNWDKRRSGPFEPRQGFKGPRPEYRGNNAPYGDRNNAPYGDRNNASYGDRNKAPYGDRNKAPYGDRNNAPYGDRNNDRNNDRFRERNNRGVEGGWDKRKPDNFSPRTNEKPVESESKAVDSAVVEDGWGKSQVEATSAWTPESVPWDDSTIQSNNTKGPEGGKGGVKKGGKPEQPAPSRPESGKGAQWAEWTSENNNVRGEGGKGKKKEGKTVENAPTATESFDTEGPAPVVDGWGKPEATTDNTWSPNNTPWGDSKANDNDAAKEPKGNLNKKSDRTPKKTDDKAQWDSSESVPAKGSGDNWGKPEPPAAFSSWPPAESAKEDSKPEASGYKGSGPGGKDRKGPGNTKALDKRPVKGGSKWENNNPADSNKSWDQPTPAAETETSSWDTKNSNAPESTGDGWGEVPKAASSGDGWGEAPKTDSWGASNTNKTLGDSNQWEQTQMVKSAEWDNGANASHGPGGAGPRSGPRSGGGPGGRNERFQRDSQEFSRRDPGSGYKRYQDSAPGSEGGSYQRDARSSLDSRNTRLNSQREMHRGPRTDGGDGSRFSGPNEGRRKPQQQWKEHGGPYGQGAGSSTHPANRGPLDYAPRTNKPGADASSSTRKPAKAKEAKPLTTPMFSNSLKCQLEWKDMGLKPTVLAKIFELGLTKPSNIQKLVMKPFSEGRDVIAQSQSQKDRTNTIAISLLQKINAEKKACQAVMICSEGVNPQKVQEDFEVWFEGSGISSVLLKDLNSATNASGNGEGNEVEGNGAPATTDSNGYGLAQQEQQQVVITTLGPLMEVLKKNLLEMSTVETVVISMRADELVGFDAFKQFWASLPRDAQVVLMTGMIMPIIQTIRMHHFRANTAVVRADELTLQWSEHFYVDVDGHDHRWTTLKKIFEANSDISHTVILTQSQSATQSLTDRLKEELGLHVISVWSMADKTEVARDFNRPDKCVLVSESILMDSLDLDHYSLVINYEMPKRAAHYVSSFGPFGKSGNRSMMINLCTVQEPAQKRILDELTSLYNIEVRVLKFD